MADSAQADDAGYARFEALMSRIVGFSGQPKSKPINKKGKKPGQDREDAAKKILEEDGFIVVGRGWPDTLCIDKRDGSLRFIEIKPTIRGKLNINQGHHLSKHQIRMKEILEKLAPFNILRVDPDGTMEIREDDDAQSYRRP